MAIVLCDDCNGPALAQSPIFCSFVVDQFTHVYGAKNDFKSTARNDFETKGGGDSFTVGMKKTVHFTPTLWGGGQNGAFASRF